jgi:hypothetical protein
MNNEIHAMLTPEEWSMISTLRDLPPSPMQAYVKELIHELVKFAADPECEEMQGDGAPCGSINAGCDQCTRVIEILRTFERRLPGTATASQ